MAVELGCICALSGGEATACVLRGALSKRVHNYQKYLLGGAFFEESQSFASLRGTTHGSHKAECRPQCHANRGACCALQQGRAGPHPQK